MINDANPQELLSSPTKNNKKAVLTDSNELGTNSDPVKGAGNKGGVGDESCQHGPSDVQLGPGGVGRDDDTYIWFATHICLVLIR